MPQESDVYQSVPPAPDEHAGVQGMPVPWRFLDCIGVLAATVVAVVVLANALGLAAAIFELPDAVDVVLLPLPLATLAAVTLLWVHVRHRAVGRLTGPTKGRAKEWLVGAGIGVAGFFVVNVVLSIVVQVGAGLIGVELAEPQPELRQMAADAAMIPWLILSAVIVAPLAEEIYFRGMVFQALRGPIGRWGAILLSAVIFAAAHVIAEPTWAGGALVFALILPLGIILAWVFDRRGSLVTPIAIHAVFNAITMALMLLAAGDGMLAIVN
jgi:membrane protease YdiL (CAAX protease family)